MEVVGGGILMRPPISFPTHGRHEKTFLDGKEFFFSLDNLNIGVKKYVDCVKACVEFMRI